MKINFFKIKVLVVLCAFLFTMSNFDFAYGFDFNDDIQKITLDYDYYEGFEDDKIIRSIKDKSWYILKSDGSLIKLNGDYLDYAGIENGAYSNFNDDYYRFVVRNEDNSTRFVYVDKNGSECLMDGYSVVYPTLNEKYNLLLNEDNDGFHKFGLYDKDNKKEIIPVIYENLKYLSDDTIIACKDEKFGIINIKQELIIPFEYNFIEYMNNNFIIADRSDGKVGVINLNNKNILPFEYDDIYTITESNDYCRIMKDNKVGLISTSDADIVIPIDYEDVMCAGNGMVIAQKGSKHGILNLKNQEVVPFDYDNIMFYKNTFTVYKDGMVGLLDKYGKEILPNNMIDIFEIDDSDNFVTVKVYVENYESKYAVYNMEGEEIVPPVYDYINYSASEKYMVVRKDWKANLVDKTTGKEVLNNSYFSDIWYINDKYFAGGSGNSFCISNFDGQQLTLEEYSSVSVINVDGENLLAAQSYYESKGFDRKFDYFKQTKGPSSWAVEEVSKAIENNLVPFEYQAAFKFNIKRSEFCSIIVSFLEEYYNTTRDDIIRVNKIDLLNPPIVDGFSEDIAICLNFGIVNGRGNGIFDGFSEITREEAAVMLTNLAKYLELYTNAEEAYLNDKWEVSAWAIDAVNFVLQNKIMHGVGNDIFSPKSNLTREQTYIIMYRMLNDTTNKIEIAQENGVTLLANKATDDGLYKGFTVQTKDKSQNFSSWINVDNPSYAPTINIADVDGDGKDEIVILLTTEYGTGVHIEKIHILNLEDLTELNIEDSFEAINNRVSSSIITKGDKVNIIIKWNGNTFEKSIDKSYDVMWFDKISFNSIIHYEIENNRIIAKVHGQMSPAGFPVTAVLEYDENLKVINIEMEDNELDKYKGITDDLSYEKISKYMEEECKNVFSPYYELLDFKISDYQEEVVEGNVEAIFYYTVIHKNYDKDPDTVEYIKEAKERGDSNYQQLYDEYLQPKEMNFHLKAVIDGNNNITLYSNVSPKGIEWTEVKMSDYIIK